MGNSTRTASALATVGLGIALLLGCARTLSGSGYTYFAGPDPSDAWSRKIEMWQARERAEGHDFGNVLAPPVSGASASASRSEDAVAAPDGAPSDLRAKYDDFRSRSKRSIARELASWIQTQAPDHYFPDGPIDHWATLTETLRGNGDDCDGLELLVYHFLRDLGFGADEIYRAIVYRRSDGQHHMVTFWFEDRDDPWVIDPTGAMTSGMPRMSEVPGWVPLKVFSENEEFSVERPRAVRQ